ncbi:hypothetical protein [Nocardia nova]|uniref:hypothetical protein n=1 Tax=Nocardia nova TaxID=37330 RepID=UPI0007A4BAFF|nr:hypothetical protein [Nocardia nova]
MNFHADFVVLHPGGEALYGSRDRDQSTRDAIRTHVPDLSTQGVGRVRAWFADNFSRPDLRPNPLADQVLARLGYKHPTGWYGPVAVTMEEDMAGHIPPLDPKVRETVDALLAPVEGTAIHAPTRATDVHSELLSGFDVASMDELNSTTTEFTSQPVFDVPDTGLDL